MENIQRFIPAEDVEKEQDRIVEEALNHLYQFVLVDKNCNVVCMNDLYLNYLGTTAEEAYGRHISHSIPNSRLHQTIESGEPTYDDIFTYEDGRQLTYSKVPIKNSKGETIGVISISSLNSLERLSALYAERDRLRMSAELYRSQLRGLEEAPSVFDAIISRSPKINQIKRVLNRVTNSRMPILLTGESGTGKEVFATAIHNAGIRSEGPFVKVNCAAIPRELLESELFGYVSGSFTGSVKGGRAGKFELANNGTILLDEIEELPLELQPKLLRVLQEYEVERIGSVDPVKLNIQIICCSNRNLYELVEQKRFREDLLYRINAMEIEVPPLRERLEDIPLLCEALIEKIDRKYNLHVSGIQNDALDYLATFHWPGNIRELEHAIERACVLVQNGNLKREDFLYLESKRHATSQGASLSQPSPVPVKSEESFSEHRSRLEKEQITEALRRSSGNKTRAATLLGISRSNLYLKMKRYGLWEPESL